MQFFVIFTYYWKNKFPFRGGEAQLFCPAPLGTCLNMLGEEERGLALFECLTLKYCSVCWMLNAEPKWGKSVYIMFAWFLTVFVRICLSWRLSGLIIEVLLISELINFADFLGAIAYFSARKFPPTSKLRSQRLSKSKNWDCTT